MSMRISDALVGLSLAGLVSACNSATGGGADAPQGSVVPCRTGGAMAFTPGCTMEWRAAAPGVEARILVLRHGDGGFRRLVVSNDGTRINVADGAEPLQAAAPRGGTVDIAVGDAAYRLPVAELRAP